MFTTGPPNPFLAVEGGNITLEWRYTFGEGSFHQLVFGNAKIPTIVDEIAGDSEPWIHSKYRSRLLTKVTDNYTSITLLGVSRTDSGTYSLTMISKPNRDRATSTLEISVQCKYEQETKEFSIHKGISVFFK